MTAIGEELILVAFPGERAAVGAFQRLQELAREQPLEMSDAVAVQRARNGHLRIDRSVLPTSGQGAVLGSSVGALLGGLLATLVSSSIGPAIMIGAAAGALLGAWSAYSEKRIIGVSSEAVHQLGGLIPPGDSAVFLLGRTSCVEAIAEHFRGSAGSILRTTLAPELAAHVQATLRADAEQDSIVSHA